MLLVGGKACWRRSCGECRAKCFGQRRGHVGVDPKQTGRLLKRHYFADCIAPVAALGHVPRVAEPLHQHVPRFRYARHYPSWRGRLARKAVPGQRRDHDVECVCGASSVRCWIGQRPDYLQLLDDRSGPPVGDDHWQRIRVLRLHMDEVDVQAIDVRDEVRIGKNLRLGSAPVMMIGPIVTQLPHRGKLHALRVVIDSFALGPSRRSDAPLEIGQIFVRGAIVERPDRSIATCLCGHGSSDERCT